MEIYPYFENIPGKVTVEKEKQTAFWSEYWYVNDRFKKLPDHNRVLAERRFLLIKGFEEYFVKKENEALGGKFRRKKAARKYCDLNDIALNSFYRWLRFYKQRGIDGIIPRYGNHRGKEKNRKKRNDKAITVEIKIDNKRPLSFLNQVKDIVKNRLEMPTGQQRSYIKLLDSVLVFSKRKHHTPMCLSLTEEEIDQLERYRKRMHKNHHARATALLMISRGYTIFEAAFETKRSCTTIYRWLRHFKDKGISFIETKPAFDKWEKIQKERITRVVDILHTPPSTYNINRTSWTYDTIIKVYKEVYGDHLSRGIMQRIIKKSKHTWRHARKVLTSSDPDYKKKVTKVLDTLRNVKENEAFFFIDELGPYKVKKYGGKALTPIGITRTIPRHQNIKGEVQATAALEAFTNQLTWLFIEHKDAEAVIALLSLLHKKYTDKAKLYITWDAISAHRATAVNNWISETNKKATREGRGPTYQVVPLPSNSQFLNVIESVFGGMKKAVIENSDYASKEEMQAAVARHFEERNAFFKENPKRVGNKIWDKEAFEVEELPGGLFKKM